MKILYVQYANPGAYPAALRAARLWRGAGHEVRFLGLEFGGADDLAIPADLADACHMVTHGRLARLVFPTQLARLILGWRPDWLYVADAVTIVAAAPALRLHRGGIVYHEHDSPQPGISALMDRQLAARNALARRADAVVLPNAARADQLAREAALAVPPVVAWNTPTRAEVGPQRAVTAAGPVRIVYAGSINAQRVPMTLIKALAAVPEAELTLIGYETLSSRGHTAALREAAKTGGCADRLILRPAMPHLALVAALGAYDATFAALPVESGNINLRHMVGASNKSFDAMGQGLALIVGPGTDWHESFVAPGFALACDPADAASIGEAFRRLAADRAATGAMGEAARQRIAGDWAYDDQFAPVLARMTAKKERA
jgi:glycosyltransferase involved in cell wall biosynthesis